MSGQTQPTPVTTTDRHAHAHGTTRPKPASEVPGPRSPAPLQTLVGVMWPARARLAMRRRYGGVFRSRDAIAGEFFHIAEREGGGT